MERKNGQVRTSYGQLSTFKFLPRMYIRYFSLGKKTEEFPRWTEVQFCTSNNNLAVSTCSLPLPDTSCAAIAYLTVSGPLFLLFAGLPLLSPRNLPQTHTRTPIVGIR